ncbi:hypothetical protein [Streptomyces sp. NPDC058424]|uniref:hypothetical protein n=1 Tax=Streptomyces sp. NPDC058424 TaxID=3346491 RepID=UPI003657536E
MIGAAPAAARDEVPSAATAAHAEDHHHDQAAAALHTVDHPGLRVPRPSAGHRPAWRSAG